MDNRQVYRLGKFAEERITSPVTNGKNRAKITISVVRGSEWYVWSTICGRMVEDSCLPSGRNHRHHPAAGYRAMPDLSNQILNW